MSMQYSDGFPRTCPWLNPTLGNLQSGLLKAKGQIQWSSLDTGELAPSTTLTHTQQPCPGESFGGLGASKWFKVSQPVQKGK